MPQRQGHDHGGHHCERSKIARYRSPDIPTQKPTLPRHPVPEFAFKRSATLGNEVIARIHVPLPLRLLARMRFNHRTSGAVYGSFGHVDLREPRTAREIFDSMA